MVKFILTLLLPIVIFLGGVKLLDRLAGHDYIARQVRDKFTGWDARPLYIRLFGYGMQDVARYWGVFDDQSLSFEQRSLKLDLFFPLFYGAALLFALWYTSSALNDGSPTLGFLAPAVIAVFADWTENLTLLTQLRLYTQGGQAGLQEAWIKTASVATVTKLWSLGLAAVFLAYVAFRIFTQPRTTSW